MATITLNINQQNRTVDIDSGTPLLWVLRDTLALTGTKFGCGLGQWALARCISTAKR